MGESNSHEHHSHHHHNNKNIGWAVVLNISVTVLQIVGGLISGSLALLSDAAHNFSDVIALIISYLARKISDKPYSYGKTFGYRRAEILAAFINIVSVIIIAVFIFIESIKRLGQVSEINSFIVMALAGVSILVNGASVLLLLKESKENMNIRSAYIHLFSDMLTSIAVLLSGLLIHLFKMYWIDTILSVLIAVYLIYISSKLLYETIRVLMQFSPKGFSPEDLQNKVCQIQGVKGIHHIHAWELTDKQLHLEAHVEFIEDMKLSQAEKVIQDLREIASEMGFTHTIFEAEYDSSHSKNLVEKKC